MATRTRKETAKGTRDNPEYVTPKQFAEIFGLGRSTVQDLIRSNRINSIEIPTADPEAKKKIRRIPYSEVERLRKG